MTGSDDISDEVAAMAERVRAEASRLPGADQVRDLAEEAIRHGGSPDMSNEDVRRLADQAIERAEQVTNLLKELAELLPPPEKVPAGNGGSRD